MSIHVEHPISSRTIEAYMPDKAESRQVNLSDRVDFGSVYAVVMSLLIWSSFILVFWYLI